MYLADSNGKKSLTATLSIVAFVVVMLKLLLSGAGIQIGGFTYSFGEIDAMEIAAVLGPILGTYAARRYTDKKYEYESYQNGFGVDEEEEYSREVHYSEEMGGKPGDGRP